MPADLELRLDQEHKVARRLDKVAQHRQDQLQGDEAEVGHQKLRRPSEVTGTGIADVDPRAFDDPGVGRQLSGQLAMAHVDGNHLASAPS